ncbi:MAG: sulfotransferase [Pseudomonadota bacterium]|nr:sulfotransferase [Pseudomonadota bacterium]
MRPVFIGGCDRSGTTFLAAQLARLEGVVALPESGFVADIARRAGGSGDSLAETARRIGADYRYRAWREAGCPEPSTLIADGMNARQLLERLVSLYADATGASPVSVFVEHSPRNIHNAKFIDDFYEDAKLLNVVRDGRAVAASLLPLDWGPTNILEMAHFWKSAVTEGFAAVEALGHERACTVFYERLVGDPEQAFAEIRRFLSLEDRQARADGTSYVPPGYSASTHKFVRGRPDPARMGRWREQLSGREIELFELEAGDLLESLGYPCMSDRRRVAPPGLLENCAIQARSWLKRRTDAARYKRRHNL